MLVSAWLVGAAIARLTGATAVILILAATAVAFLFEVAVGWSVGRRTSIRSIVGPHVVTVEETCTLLVHLDRPMTRRMAERCRLAVCAPGDGGRSATLLARSTYDHMTSTVVLSTTFATAGVVDLLTVTVDVAGPAGLVWWRTTRSVVVEPVHVAPVANGPLLETRRTNDEQHGATIAPHGRRQGDIDGVRPWRPGDPINAVHWPSSLRADDLVVHDRITAGDEHWIIDLPSHPGSDPGCDSSARLRWTLDEGRRRGHTVGVRAADGTTHLVHDAATAAVWAASVADQERRAKTPDAPHRIALLHREIPLRPSVVESETSITAGARWAAAAAAFASMAMLVGAVASSAATIILVALAVVVGAGVSLAVAHRSGTRPLALQIAIVVAIAVAIGAIIVQAADVHGLLAVLRGPMPNVLLLLVVLHGFEVIDRRTLRVHQAITLVIAAYAAGLRIDEAFGWWLAVWATAFVASVATTSRIESATTTERAPTSAPRWIAGLAVGAAATLAVLSIVPVPDGPARLGLPALSNDAPTVPSGALAAPDGSTNADTPTSPPGRGSLGGVVGYPGFTETLDTSIRGDLGDDVVMRVRAPRPAFWRGQTFSEFDGRTWRVSSDVGQPQIGPTIDIEPTLGDALGTRVPTEELIQTYFVEQDLPNIVFAAARPTTVIFDGTLWTRPDGALRSDVTLTKGSVYTVLSERVQVTAERLRSQGDLGILFDGFRATGAGDEIEPFLDIPATTTQRTIDLATSLRTPGQSTYDTIVAYEAWLGANTEYDLDAPVPAEQADAVDDFLFESRRGFCEQIASTLAIMLRTQGVPARLATGYVPGERDRVSGVWKVRASDAHAWVEVWFPETGWQSFDPTARVPLAGEVGASTVGGDLVAATVASVTSHVTEIAGLIVATCALWAVARLVRTLRHRRRRGRWGLLQDRFGRLGPSPPGNVTNPRIAAHVDRTDGADARTVADTLDRAAFDPSWEDTDDDYQRTRAAIVTLERTRR